MARVHRQFELFKVLDRAAAATVALADGDKDEALAMLNALLDDYDGRTKTLETLCRLQAMMYARSQFERRENHAHKNHLGEPRPSTGCLEGPSTLFPVGTVVAALRAGGGKQAVCTELPKCSV